MSVTAQSNRNWWSLKSPPSKDAPAFQDKSSSKSTQSLNSKLASVMGLKSKKHPSLTIQEPPSPLRSHFSSSVSPSAAIPSRPRTSPSFTNRPPSKSVSSTRSRVDSIGPRTPTDGQRDTSSPRHSLLTLSDFDPFAARGISLPQSPQDPNRLSAYSNSSGPDYFSKSAQMQLVSRGSITSSSSHSRAHSGELSIQIPSPQEPAQRHSSSKYSGGSLHRNASILSSESQTGSTKGILGISITDKNRLSQPDLPPNPRPPMRARGMTDGGGRQLVLRDDSFSPKAEKNAPFITRQPSTSRLAMPAATAPPTSRLPLPPDGASDEPFPTLSPISFAPSSFSPIDKNVAAQQLPLIKPLKLPDRPIKSPNNNNVDKHPRTLKKSLSQQSLNKHRANALTSVAVPVNDQLSDNKVPRKQRSFHHTRVPVPAIPLPRLHSSQSSSQLATNSVETPPIPSESRRGSASGPSTPIRKRLFSGSSTRRGSTSQGLPGEDDAFSILSGHTDHDPSPNISSPQKKESVMNSSFWDEHPLRSPTASIDYTPLQIMSPKEMSELEASLKEDLKREQRSRVVSMTSTVSGVSATLNPDRISYLNDSLKEVNALPARSSSLIGSNTGGKSPSINAPSGISPPPRLWSRPLASAGQDSEELGFIPLSPPPRSRIRKKASSENRTIEKVSKRMSLLRKPSFLDIDDDVEKPPSESIKLPPMNSSFLDLARESFDTIRSSD